jgi:adenosylcobinamide amidohydrolase
LQIKAISSAGEDAKSSSATVLPLTVSGNVNRGAGVSRGDIRECSRAIVPSRDCLLPILFQRVVSHQGGVPGVVLFKYKSVDLSACGRWLEVDLSCPHDTFGWTLIGGGRRQAQSVFWHSVSGADLPLEVDARQLFEDRRKQRAGDSDGVGFLTGCSLAEFVERRCDRGKLSARCIATVGLRNALRIGDPPSPDCISPHTINILLQTSCALSECASLEALSLVAEARTLAVLEGQIPSGAGRSLATGTGTDCIVVASPLPSNNEPEVAFVGKHTEIGHLIGSCVYEAVGHGIRQSSAPANAS